MERVFRDVLAKADIRNAIEGLGISITSTLNEPATVSASEELQQLFDADFALAEANALLPNARTITASGPITLTDSGAGGTLAFSVADGAIDLAKLKDSRAFSVIGRPFDTNGPVRDIVASADGQALVRNGTVLEFGTVAAIGGGTGQSAYTAGDVLYANSTTTLATLAIGSASAILNVSGGAPAWIGKSTFLGAALTAWAGGDTPSAFTLGIVDAADAAAWRTAIGIDQTNIAALGFVTTNTNQTSGLTGNKTWSGAQHFSGAVSRAPNGSDRVSIGSITSGWAGFSMQSGAAPTNAKAWEFRVDNAGVLSVAAINDAVSVGRALLEVTRSGVAITAVTFGNSTDYPTQTFYGQYRVNLNTGQDYQVNSVANAYMGVNRTTGASGEAGFFIREGGVTQWSVNQYTSNSDLAFWRRTLGDVMRINGTSGIYGYNPGGGKAVFIRSDGTLYAP